MKLKHFQDENVNIIANISMQILKQMQTYTQKKLISFIQVAGVEQLETLRFHTNYLENFD